MVSILQSEKDRCYLCGRRVYLEEHHIFFGTANRKLSEKYGLKVYLCPECHRDIKFGVHGDGKISKKYRDFLHIEGQEAFEKYYPDLNFRKIFGKNYL